MMRRNSNVQVEFTIKDPKGDEKNASKKPSKASEQNRRADSKTSVPLRVTTKVPFTHERDVNDRRAVKFEDQVANKARPFHDGAIYSPIQAVRVTAEERRNRAGTLNLESHKRRVVAASNAKDLAPPPPPRSRWRIPTNDLVDRDMALIDMDLEVMNSHSEQWAKEPRPHTSNPRRRSYVNNLPKSYRPRSAYSTSGPVLLKLDHEDSLYDEKGNPKDRPRWSKECRLKQEHDERARPEMSLPDKSRSTFQSWYRLKGEPHDERVNLEGKFATSSLFEFAEELRVNKSTAHRNSESTFRHRISDR
jgi:hypothetical protein